jgi:hypothetical protein
VFFEGGGMQAPEEFFVEFARSKGDIFRRNDMRSTTILSFGKTCMEYIDKYKDWSTYSSYFQYNNIDPYEATALRGHFILDFDDENDLRKAQKDAYDVFRYLTESPRFKIPANMIRVYFSGKKGIHLLVPYQVFGIEWHENLDQIYRIMAETLKTLTANKTLDMTIYERRRVIRLPYSYHSDTGSYKVQIQFKHVLMHTEEELRKLAKDPMYGRWIAYEPPRVIAAAAATFADAEKVHKSRFKQKFNTEGNTEQLDFDPPCIEEMIDGGPVSGKRNNMAAIIINHWKQRGYSEQEIWDLLVEWNSKAKRNPLSARDLKTVFNSISKRPYHYGCNKIMEVWDCPATCRESKDGEVACKFFKERTKMGG